MRSILFNIFGGITRCDEVARGILAGARADDDRRSRSSSGSTARTPRRGGGSSPRRRRRTSTSSRRCSTPRAARWSWRDDATSGASAREAYRESEAHREGADLDLSSSGRPGARTALDVATGGGHVARRLREAGLEVVTVDPAPGMQPDVVCRAEDLPFADGSFDVVACRVAAHHFDDVAAAVREMARVARDRVLVVDNLFMGEAAEEAERLRDPSHVRNYSEAEWRGVLRATPACDVEEVERVRASRSSSSRGSSAPAATARTPSASASSLADRIDGRPRSRSTGSR